MKIVICNFFFIDEKIKSCWFEFKSIVDKVEKEEQLVEAEEDDDDEEEVVY